MKNLLGRNFNFVLLFKAESNHSLSTNWKNCKRKLKLNWTWNFKSELHFIYRTKISFFIGLNGAVHNSNETKRTQTKLQYTVILQNLLFKDFPNCKVWTDKPTKDTKFNFKEESYLKKDFSGGMHIRKFTWVYILTLTLTRRG